MLAFVEIPFTQTQTDTQPSENITTLLELDYKMNLHTNHQEGNGNHEHRIPFDEIVEIIFTREQCEGNQGKTLPLLLWQM